MLDKAQHKLINQWVDGYQHLSLLSILAKISFLSCVHRTKLFKVSEISEALKVDQASVRRIFFALEVMGLCRIARDQILLSRLAKSFLKDRTVVLKTIISADRWAPIWLGFNNPKKLSNPILLNLNAEFNLNNSLDSILNEWFALESSKVSKEIISGINLTGINSIADIGGGDGKFLLSIIKRNTNIYGTVFDKIYKQKNNQLNQNSLVETEKRISRIGSDFFKKMRINADLVLLKSVLHNWDDIRASRILKNLYISIQNGARICIIERIFPNTESLSKNQKMNMLDLRMLFVHGGRERTLPDLKALIKASGFLLVSNRKTKNGFYILEAIKNK
jgi:hypothetical protein